MKITIRIARSDGQWVAEVPRARHFHANSPSLERLRKQVDFGLREFFPELASLDRREVFELPRAAEDVLRDLAKAEDVARRAQARAAMLMGVSGGRAQQLLKD